MGMGKEEPQSAFSTGGKFVFDDNSETPDSQVTVYQFPSYTLIWEHKAGLNNGLNGRSWGVEWNGTEGTIILNDEGYQIITERKQANLDSVKKPGSGDPRPAHVRNFLACVKSREQPVLNEDWPAIAVLYAEQPLPAPDQADSVQPRVVPAALRSEVPPTATTKVDDAGYSTPKPPSPEDAVTAMPGWL